jgi:hypothetical protein
MFRSLLVRTLGFLRGLPEGAGANLEAVSNHVDRVIGTPAQHLHEIYSPDQLHIDLLHYPPAGDRDFHYVVTSGMSDRPMTNAGDPIDAPLVELAIALPSGREVSQEGFKKPGMWEPLRLLKNLARYPHNHGTFLARTHTVSLEDPAFTPMAAVLMMPPVLVRDLAEPLQLAGGREIHFLALYLLHKDELAVKLERGLDELLVGFQRDAVTEEYDLNRPSVVEANG